MSFLLLFYSNNVSLILVMIIVLLSLISVLSLLIKFCYFGSTAPMISV